MASSKVLFQTVGGLGGGKLRGECEPLVLCIGHCLDCLFFAGNMCTVLTQLVLVAKPRVSAPED